MSYVEHVSDVVSDVEVIQIMWVVLNFQHDSRDAEFEFMLKVQPIVFGVSLLLSQIIFDDQVL